MRTLKSAFILTGSLHLCIKSFSYADQKYLMFTNSLVLVEAADYESVSSSAWIGLSGSTRLFIFFLFFAPIIPDIPGVN